MNIEDRKSKSVAPKSFYVKYGKRAIDIVASGLGLVLTLPVNMILAIGTGIDVGSPIMFHSRRLGRYGQPFTLSKFRNMTNDTDEDGNLLLPELRVTKFGRFVRKTSLDELLNFWSILKGDMSIIGPRPLELKDLDLYSEKHIHRLDVRPGLECPMPYKLDHGVTWQEQFDNDVWYAKNVCLRTDIKLAFRLLYLVFDKEQRRCREDGTKGMFIGYWDGVAVSESELDDFRDNIMFFPASEGYTREEAIRAWRDSLSNPRGDING